MHVTVCLWGTDAVPHFEFLTLVVVTHQLTYSEISRILDGYFFFFPTITFYHDILIEKSCEKFYDSRLFLQRK